VLGGLASYLLGRTVLRRWGSRVTSRHKLLRALALAVAREPWRICLLARAAAVPVPLKNYGFAALDAPMLPYAASLMLVRDAPAA